MIGRLLARVFAFVMGCVLFGFGVVCTTHNAIGQAFIWLAISAAFFLVAKIEPSEGEGK